MLGVSRVVLDRRIVRHLVHRVGEPVRAGSDGLGRGSGEVVDPSGLTGDVDGGINSGLGDATPLNIRG